MSRELFKPWQKVVEKATWNVYTVYAMYPEGKMSLCLVDYDDVEGDLQVDCGEYELYHEDTKTFDRPTVEYLCEIAFCIWANRYWDEMNNILAEYTSLDFDYECYVDFYKCVLDTADRKNMFMELRPTLLETIYETINNRSNFMKLRDDFLSTYKK